MTIGNCPWPGCGGNAVSSRQHNPAWWDVECRDCGASGPSAKTEDAAIAAWNRIAGPDAVIGRLRYVSAETSQTLTLGNVGIGGIRLSQANGAGLRRWIGFVLTEQCSAEFLAPLAHKDEALAAVMSAARKAIGGNT